MTSSAPRNGYAAHEWFATRGSASLEGFAAQAARRRSRASRVYDRVRPESRLHEQRASARGVGATRFELVDAAAQAAVERLPELSYAQDRALDVLA